MLETIQYVQCSQCGHIYEIYKEYKIEQVYINSRCPKCNAKRGLYLGTHIDEFYELMDINLDQRYYEYNTKL